MICFALFFFFSLLSLLLKVPPLGNTAGQCLLLSPSVASEFVTPWTVAHQAPLSVEFSRQEDWRGLPFPTVSSRLQDRTGVSCVSCIAGGFFTTRAT